MPPKGFKKPEPTRCATCHKILPAYALQGLVRRLRDLRAMLDEPCRWEGEGQQLWDRTQVLNAKGWLDHFLAEEGNTCFGHGAKPGPKKKPEVDPRSSDPDDLPKPKRRRLRAVQNGGGDE